MRLEVQIAALTPVFGTPRCGTMTQPPYGGAGEFSRPSRARMPKYVTVVATVLGDLCGFHNLILIGRQKMLPPLSPADLCHHNL